MDCILPASFARRERIKQLALISSCLLIHLHISSQGESVDMGTFTNTYCFGNEPYECEMVYHGANIVEDGEFKCHICNEDGERQVSDTDEGFEE